MGNCVHFQIRMQVVFLAWSNVSTACINIIIIAFVGFIELDYHMISNTTSFTVKSLVLNVQSSSPVQTTGLAKHSLKVHYHFAPLHV